VITLTLDERRRFQAWLIQEALTTRQLAEQMEKIGTPAVFINKNIQEAAAFMIIANYLEPGEMVQLSADTGKP